MGIISNTKEFIARKTKSVGKRASDFVAKSAALSPHQLSEIETKKTEYFKPLSKMDSKESIQFVERNLGAIAIEVHQAYLNGLKETYNPIDVAMDKFDDLNRIKFFDITKWVTDSNEKNLDKLVNVYQVVSGETCNIALIYNRKKEGCRVSIGIANSNEEEGDPAIVQSYVSRIFGALKGNFPGVKTKNESEGIPEVLKCLHSRDTMEKHSVAIVSNLASEKSEDFISQSMEKLLDGIVPKCEDDEYTVVLIANPVTNLYERKNRLCELYSALIPYASWQTNYSCSESENVGSNATLGMNAGFGFGSNRGTSVSAGADGVGVSQSYGTHKSLNFGAQFARMSNVSVQVGANEGLTQNYGNYGVQHTLELVKKQLDRLEESSALGMWEFAAYVTSRNPVVANNVAHMYLSLTQGEESYVTNACVELWDGEREEEAQIILDSIQKLQHPVFGLKESYDDDWLQYPTIVTPSTFLSGKELAKALNFPRKSVSGLPVIQSAEFGRNIIPIADKYESDLEIGTIYHMHNKETETVKLSTKELTAHTFVTGSTGSGKSNTIYKLIDELCMKKDSNKHFLVIEPAKGEYKNVFGGKDDVSVYGTNFKMAPLLKLNPFSFPKEIHVLEHIDRLIEIFNACWPMYAAMPAVLKDAIEESYESCGWSLTHSVCEPKRFPTFETLLSKLPEIMEKSAYSKDAKSDYTGALVTRIKSLTNGINGQIFCSREEILNEDLFDKNVIIDLSRIGSSETKSLLMGILMIKLQEYRMSKVKGTDNELCHVTVLEEAHNLLRRTSSDQSQDSSNLQGKSVEMLANAIAEMRTYGEGFIIVDQAPGLLDMSVIRNTNTKIVMRLPDESDRVLVGKSAGLNDEQIIELSKLECGVAAVFQSQWLEPVLCKIDEFTNKCNFQHEIQEESLKNGSRQMNMFFEKLLGSPMVGELSEEDADKIRIWIDSLNVGRNAKSILNSVLEPTFELSQPKKQELLYRVVNGNDFLKYAGTVSNREAGLRFIEQRIMEMLNVSNIIAEDIRKQIFLFAAERIDRKTEQYRELLYFGGVK